MVWLVGLTALWRREAESWRREQEKRRSAPRWLGTCTTWWDTI